MNSTFIAYKTLEVLLHFNQLLEFDGLFLCHFVMIVILNEKKFKPKFKQLVKSLTVTCLTKLNTWFRV